MLRRAASLAGPLTHLLFPRICLGCREADGAGDGVLCRRCRGLMGRLRRRGFCRSCGQSVGPYAAVEPCSRCRDRSPLAGVLRVAEYAPPLAGIVTALKYGRRPELAGVLGDWMARRVGWTAVDHLVAVPLHPARLRQRGYNQAELLAAAIGAAIRRPVRADLVRLRDTPPQAAASAAERRLNVRDAFGPNGTPDLAGRRVLLIDDVTTTGATAAEAARTLRRAGARSVTLLVAAVAELPAMRVTEEPV